MVSKNYSVIGAGLSPVDKVVNSYRTQLSKIKRDIDDGNEYDILLLEGGMNTIELLKVMNKDAAPSEIIGSMDELDDKSKISGIVENNISFVYDYFKSSGQYIFFIYPAIPEAEENEYFTTYKNFMMEYCKEKDIAMIDLNDIGMEYNDTYYSVGTHYTDIGYKLTSDYVAKIIAETIASEAGK